ncbi:MAG: ATPase [Actinomycetota bacterium]|nr:ATPase [Actinomycetota bacterium]
MTEDVTFDSLMTIPRALLDGSEGRQAAHVLGVDGGATKTLAAVLEVVAGRVATGAAGPTNADAVGVEAALQAATEAIREALDGAGVGGGDLGASVVAIAGTIPSELGDTIRKRIGIERVYVLNDVVAAWAAGTGCKSGIAAIAGTGSHVFGVSDAGESWRVGGWGHILGDEGSGYWLGLGGLKAALKYRDGSGEPTSMLSRAKAFYSLEKIEDLQPLVYGKPLTKAEIGAFATEVAAAAVEGDAVALELFDRGAAELSRQVQAAARALDVQGKELLVAMIGSVFAKNALVRERFEREVRAFAPGAKFTVPDVPPVVGSLLLALRAEGYGEYDVDTLKRQLNRAD